MRYLRALGAGLSLALCLTAVSCGGGGGGGGTTTPPPPPPPVTSNVAAVIADSGPTGNSVNTLFTSVTICVPGSSSCQTIDHIQVDTGSYGLRILAPVLTLSLPVETLTNGDSLAECTQFVDGYSWGPISLADITIASETAKSVPVQVIGDSRFTTVPAGCSSTGGVQEDTVATFGANGILGIGPFELDCGDCATTMHGLYYACAGTACTETTVPDAMQMPNPVTHFAADNNGSIVVLPAVSDPAAGTTTVSGSLIFGIDTQTNNASGTQTVLTVDSNAQLTMTYNGQALTKSFIDSGSNGIYFTDASIATCTDTGLTTFYCPASTLMLGLSIQGQNGVMVNNLTFGVGNTKNMLNNPANFVFPELAGTNPNANSFDYGLAFFYGKRVAVAVELQKTSVGTGPYIAF
jgi:hypothetical protein